MFPETCWSSTYLQEAPKVQGTLTHPAGPTCGQNEQEKGNN